MREVPSTLHADLVHYAATTARPGKMAAWIFGVFFGAIGLGWLLMTFHVIGPKPQLASEIKFIDEEARRNYIARYGDGTQLDFVGLIGSLALSAVGLGCAWIILRKPENHPVVRAFATSRDSIRRVRHQRSVRGGRGTSFDVVTFFAEERKLGMLVVPTSAGHGFISALQAALPSASFGGSGLGPEPKER